MGKAKPCFLRATIRWGSTSLSADVKRRRLVTLPSLCFNPLDAFFPYTGGLTALTGVSIVLLLGLAAAAVALPGSDLVDALTRGLS